jgi:hypothetical protein
MIPRSSSNEICFGGSALGSGFSGSGFCSGYEKSCRKESETAISFSPHSFSSFSVRSRSLIFDMACTSLLNPAGDPIGKDRDHPQERSDIVVIK